MYRQGDIVLIPIPFTNLSSSKKRPVLIISNDKYNKDCDDIIVVAITSNLNQKIYTIELSNNDLSDGFLQRNSCVRVDKIYALSQEIIIKKFGHVKNQILEDVNCKIVEIVKLT